MWVWLAVAVLVFAAVGIVVVAVHGSGTKTAGSVSQNDVPSVAGDEATQPPVASPSAAPTTTPAAAPVTLTGSGDDVRPVPAAYRTTPTIVHVTGNAGAADDFTVTAGTQLLVNTTDPYDGYTAMNFDDGTSAASIVITAANAWSVTFAPITTAPSFDKTATYAGDRVVLYTGAAGVAAITGNAGGADDFTVVEIPASGTSNLLVNSVDPYTGRVPIQAGPELLVITAASGSGWTITTTPN